MGTCLGLVVGILSERHATNCGDHLLTGQVTSARLVNCYLVLSSLYPGLNDVPASCVVRALNTSLYRISIIVNDLMFYTLECLLSLCTL